MDRWVEIALNYLEKLIGLMFMAVAGVTLAQVFCRYVLRFSLTWSHEVVILLIIWIVWLAMPIGLDRAGHLRVTFVTDLFPDASQRVIARINLILCAVFFGLVFALSFPVIEAFEGMVLVTIPVPINARYWAAAAGSLLSVIVVVNRFIHFREEAE